MDKVLFDALSGAYEYVSYYHDDLVALFGLPLTETEKADVERVEHVKNLLFDILRNYGYTPTNTGYGVAWHYKKPEAYQPFLTHFPVKRTLA